MNMEEDKEKLNMNKIFCRECNEIKKIKINCDWTLKLIKISFECGHERNDEIEYDENKYCLNCIRNVMQEKSCKVAKHIIIKKGDLYFYCKDHLKKFDAYCEKCNRNLCESCECDHEDIRNNFEYYFSLSQLDELLSVYNEVQNYINAIYSLDCNANICKEFESYYNGYIYLNNNELFHANIIYNISLFYDFFKFLNNTKLVFSGCFSIFGINTITDNTIFYDSNFKKQFDDLIDMKNFNFNNVMILFCLSKRFNIKRELFEEFSNKIYSYISNNILEFDDIEKNIKNIIKFDEYLNLFKEGINSKKLEIVKIQNEIDNELLSIKLSKIAIPSNLKRKMINILQREIIKKYKYYLHKVKPNLFILNNIKKRYDFIKKSNSKLYMDLNLESKAKEIDIAKPEDNNNFIDNVYFEKDFELKSLLNTFIYFTQKLRYQKSNETHYSKKDLDKGLSLNQLMLKRLNSKDNINENTTSNNSGKLNCEPLDNSINQINNISANSQNEVIDNEQLEAYRKYLSDLKNNFKDSYKDIFIKETINLTYIVDALFKNDFSEIIEISEKNKNNDNTIDDIINECLNKLNNIKYEEDENEKLINHFYSQIKNNDFQMEGETIFSSLMRNRKYKNILFKIKGNFKNNDMEKNKSLFINLSELLIKLGGFDERNAKLIIKIIKTYLSNAKEIQDKEKTMEKNKLFFKENSELNLEIDQLKKIKNYIHQINEELKEYNNYSELKEMATIKESFEKNVDKYINNSIDNNFQTALKQIKEFIKGKDIETILKSLKSITKDIQSKFYIDETLNLISYCWCIQNGHDYIVDL